MAPKVDSEADIWDRKTKDRFERRVPPSVCLGSSADCWRANSKDRSEYLDPCQDAAARSIRCLHRNGGDKSLCSDYFQSVARRGYPRPDSDKPTHDADGVMTQGVPGLQEGLGMDCRFSLRGGMDSLTDPTAPVGEKAIRESESERRDVLILPRASA